MSDQWRARAACRHKLRFFFPPDPRTAVKDIQEARRLCASCPVFAECRADDEASVEAVSQIFGFRAGRTEDQRREAARAKFRAADERSRSHDLRHAKILALTRQGLSAADIAVRVGVTERTVVRCRSGHCTERPVETAA